MSVLSLSGDTGTRSGKSNTNEAIGHGWKFTNACSIKDIAESYCHGPWWHNLKDSVNLGGRRSILSHGKLVQYLPTYSTVSPSAVNCDTSPLLFIHIRPIYPYLTYTHLPPWSCPCFLTEIETNDKGQGAWGFWCVNKWEWFRKEKRDRERERGPIEQIKGG